MTDTAILAKVIAREFRKYLGRSGHTQVTIGMYLERILRDWVALPMRREQFKIDTLTPEQWVEIETTIVSSYRTRWQAQAKKTRQRNKHAEAIAKDKARQLSLDI